MYQSLYVQSRGALKQELTRCLRTGRAVRRPSRKVGQRKNRIPNMINIAERPAEADDREGAAGSRALTSDSGAEEQARSRAWTG